MDKLLIYEFSPLRLTLERIGPFRESLYTVDFTNKDNLPCNFYMLIAPNGFGKTTVLDAIACAMSLLGEKQPSQYGLEDLDKGEGRIQLDVSVRYHWQGENHRIVLSIHAGHFGSEIISLYDWGESDDALQKAEAEKWYRIGFTGRNLRPFSTHKTDEFVEELLGVIQHFTGDSPDNFNDSSIDVPTVLSFSAYRDIPSVQSLSGPQAVTTKPAHWGYQCVHQFSAHNETWLYSLDSLLVWLKWLDDGRFEKACDMLNQYVFDGGKTKRIKDIQRDPPQAVIEVNGERHRLDRLSSGEKNIAQLMLRIGTHMTKNAIILIDEFDVHLHIRWQYHLFEALKSLAARDDINVTVILTTHSVEILETYINRMKINEDGLVKGGHLIEKGMR